MFSSQNLPPEDSCFSFPFSVSLPYLVCLGHCCIPPAFGIVPGWRETLVPICGWIPEKHTPTKPLWSWQAYETDMEQLSLESAFSTKLVQEACSRGLPKLPRPFLMHSLSLVPSHFLKWEPGAYWSVCLLSSPEVLASRGDLPGSLRSRLLRWLTQVVREAWIPGSWTPSPVSFGNNNKRYHKQHLQNGSFGLSPSEC